MIEKCIRKICWEEESDQSLIGKFERLFHKLKRDGGNVEFFWQQICQNNVYAAVFLITVLKAQYGELDADLQVGKQRVREYLKALTKYNDSAVLALLISGDFETVKRIYEQDLVNMGTAGEMVNRLDGMCTEQQLGTILCNWLRAALYSSNSHQMSIYKAIVLKFRLDGKNFQKNPALENYCKAVCESGDLTKMIGIMTVFEGIYLPDVTGMSLEEFRKTALSAPSPIGCYMYEMILEQSDLPDTEKERQLKTFTVQFGLRDAEHIWSDFHLFSSLVKKEPDKLPDYLKRFFYLERFGDHVCPAVSRREHYCLVEEPFRALVSVRSLYLIEFLRLIKPCSLFAYMEDKPYMKNKTWNTDGGGQSLNLYMRYIDYMLTDYTVAEAVEIYINSPMKAYIDFFYFIRRLWKKIQVEGGQADQIRTLFADYRFRGHLERTQKESYKVSVSSVTSTYKFPVLYKWGAKHEELLEKLCQSNRPVFFKIYGINPKTSMVFAYEVQEESVRPSTWIAGNRMNNIWEGYRELIQEGEKNLQELNAIGKESNPVIITNRVKKQTEQMTQILNDILKSAESLVKERS